MIINGFFLCVFFVFFMHKKQHYGCHIVSMTEFQMSIHNILSRDVRKPDFCICKNKDADQRLCFRYLDSTIPFLPKFKISSL